MDAGTELSGFIRREWSATERMPGRGSHTEGAVATPSKEGPPDKPLQVKDLMLRVHEPYGPT